MSNNYFLDDNKPQPKGYSKKKTYIQNHQVDTLMKKYILLPEEYNIFSEMDFDDLNTGDAKQHELITLCLTYLRQNLLTLYENSGIICVLPKLVASHDVDGTIIFYWSHTTFRATLSFESADGDHDSYCVIILQSNEYAVSTSSSKINLDNYKTIIDGILKLVLENA